MPQNYSTLGKSAVLERTDNKAGIIGKLTLYDNIGTDDDIFVPAIRGVVKVEKMMLLTFILQGTMTVRQSFTEFILKKNDIFLVNNGLFGEFLDYSPDLQFFTVIIHDNFANPLTSMNNPDKFHDMMFNEPVFHCSDSQMESFLQAYQQLVNLSFSDYRYREEILRCLTEAMLFTIYSLADRKVLESSDSDERSARQMDIFRRFISEAKVHFRKEHKMSFYADRLCMTPKYLSQVVYKVSGHFGKDFIRDFLVMEAKAMLKSGYSIQEVCDELNFNSPSFFGRYFKDATGMTPFEYQKNG